jgi:hypothetical protein
MIVLEVIQEDTGFSARGPAAPALNEVAEGSGVEIPPSPLKTLPSDEFWLRSGLEFAVVSGSAEDVGTVLLEYLAERGR